MFPNPHDALPLPTHPNLEQYKKLAKDLVKVANAADSPALTAWITNWLHTLTRLARFDNTDQLQVDVDQWAHQFGSFIETQKSAGKLSLSKSQFALARAHGFESWPKFSSHLDALARASSAESDFESAADAIIQGDLDALSRLLKENPALVHARSARQHRATLLHYVAANGIESYRQKTPTNAPQIARLLLDSGADVNAEADVYGDRATALELVATSSHPERAGVQEALMQLLLDRGTSPSHKSGRNLIAVCLANGRPHAAEFLAKHNFPLNLEAASGLGRLDRVKDFFDFRGILTRDTTPAEMQRGFAWACEYGKNDVVQFLLHRGASVTADVSGQTALHWAVIGAHPDTIQILLTHGANPEAKNAYDSTPPGQALWSAARADRPLDYVPVLQVLLDAGAKVPENAAVWLQQQKQIDADYKWKVEKMLAAYKFRIGK